MAAILQQLINLSGHHCQNLSKEHAAPITKNKSGKLPDLFFYLLKNPKMIIRIQDFVVIPQAPAGQSAAVE